MAKIYPIGISTYSTNNNNKIHSINFGKNPRLNLMDRRILRLGNKVSNENLHRHLDIIAGPATEGRGVGQPGIEVAKDYISGQFENIGLSPLDKINLTGFLQKFSIKKYITRTYNSSKNTGGYIDTFTASKTETSNVIGVIKGHRDNDEYLLITAHYDHLGKSEQNNIIFPGADDDASGIASLLEIARILKKTHPKKSIVFAALSGEEAGHNGANKLGEELKKYGLTKQSQVLNLEMLAGKSGSTLDAWSQKGGLTKNIMESLKKAGTFFDIDVKIHPGDPGSDARAFSEHDIPSVCVAWDYISSGTHPHYHRADDTVENVDFNILGKATKMLTAATYLVANKISQTDSSLHKNLMNFVTYITNKFRKSA